MDHAFIPTPPELATPVLQALAALQEAAAPPLADSDAPVRLADLPSVWRTLLLDEPHVYEDLLPPGCSEIARSDCTRLVTRVARQLDQAYRIAGLLALMERGPEPDALTGAPLLSRWAPGIAGHGDLVLTGHMTGHPRLGSTWIHTTPLMGLDSRGQWARSWSRWYRLGESTGEEHRLDYWLARVPVALIEADDAQVARHFAALRERVGRILEPLDEPHTGVRP